MSLRIVLARNQHCRKSCSCYHWVKKSWWMKPQDSQNDKVMATVTKNTLGSKYYMLSASFFNKQFPISCPDYKNNAYCRERHIELMTR